MTKDLKVGLLLYGQPRHIFKTKVHEQYHREIIDRYDTDVFAHAWSFSDRYDIPSWSAEKGTTLGNVFDRHEDPEEAILERYPSIKEIFVESQRLFTFPKRMTEYMDQKWEGNQFYSRQNLHNIASQLYSISAVASLAAANNPYEYDYWILARYDTELVNFPDLTSLEKYVPIFMPEGGHWNDLIQIYDMTDDYESWSCRPERYLRDLYFDMMNPEVYENLILPIPEFFKMGAYDLRGHPNDVVKLPMYANVIRNTYS